MPESTPNSKSPRNGFRKRTLIALVLLTICTTVWLLVRHYTNPESIRAAAQTYLQRYLNGSVSIGSARFSWSDGITLYDVDIYDKWATPKRRVGIAHREGNQATRQRGIAHEAAPSFSCRKVTLMYDMALAMRGRFAVDSVVAQDPVCRIIRDRELGRTNLTDLLRFSSVESSNPLSLPAIELRGAQVDIISREAAGDHLVDHLSLTVRARPVGKQGNLYDIVWREEGDRRASGHSQIDLQTGRVSNRSGGLPWMSIEAVMLAINARYDGTGAWSDLLGLGGTIRATDYDVSDPLGPGGLRSATVELRQASLSIPISDEERALPPEQRYLRFEKVVGEIQLTGEAVQATFHGEFHGHPCQVTASLSGGVQPWLTLDDVNFDAKLSIHSLELPRPDGDSPPSQVRFIRRWPKLARFYRNYDPHGPVDIEIAVAKRAGPEEPVALRRAVLTARGGDAAYHAFPYRGYHLSGSVLWTPNGVFIRDITGRHGDGAIRVNGKLERPTREAAKQVHLEARNIRIDPELVAALPEQYGRIEREFRPQGTLDVQADLTQPEVMKGAKPLWTRDVTITLRDVAARYSGFPYPVDHLRGQLHTGGGRMEVIDVEGRAGSGRIALQGSVALANPGPRDLALTLRATDVALDDNLLSALPDSLRSRIQAFDPDGRIDVEGPLRTGGANGRLRYDFDIQWKGGAARYAPFPLRVTGVQGRLRLTPDRLTLADLTGSYGDVRVRVEGVIDGLRAQPDGTVTIRTENLYVTEPILSALPASVSTVLSPWRIEGPMETETTVHLQDGRPAETVTRAKARDITIAHPFFPVPFQHVRGEFITDGSRVRATGVTARYGHALVALDLDLRQDRDRQQGLIKVSAKGLTLGTEMRGLLPDRLVAPWDQTQSHGTMNLYLERLEFLKPSVAEPGTWSVSGYLEFNDVAILASGELDHVSGTMNGSGFLSDRKGGTALTGELALSGARVARHRITRIASDWSYARMAGKEGGFRLPAIRARLHDGSLTSDYELNFNPERTTYRLSATVHDMQVASFLEDERAEHPISGALPRVSGLADGRLYLSGTAGQVSTRRGGGSFEVREGEFFHLPLFAAILQVLNLTIPQKESFDVAQADFFLLGNRIQLQDIILRGRTLTLVGHGTMTLPDRGVDLDLVNISPHEWAQVPVLAEFVEGASRELVELHVTGPITRPKVRAKPLPGVQKEFKRLFQKRRSKKITATAP